MEILYIEKDAINYELTKEICETFPYAEKVVIKHYKNLFDKKLPYKHKKSLLLAENTGSVLLPVPESYGYGSQSYFLKTTLNCIFDCEYCYLKGAFRNDIPVIFVNTQEMQKTVSQELHGITGKVQLYPSNRTDLLGFEFIGHFHRDWLPFFEELDDVSIESRTKSVGISPLLAMEPSTNVEIAYSLNPQEVVSVYEKGTPPITKRIKVINQLIENNRKVGLRIMPLLPVHDREKIYENFFKLLHEQINITACSSVFFGSFLLTKRDLKHMIKKNPDSDLRNFLQVQDENLVRVQEKIRKKMYDLVVRYFPDAKISFDDLELFDCGNYSRLLCFIIQ